MAMAMADTKIFSNEPNQTLLFVYGTLKKDFPNYRVLQDLITQKETTYLGICTTHQSHPLTIGPRGIPYLLHLPGQGQRIKGELYSVSTQALVLLDKFEGTNFGHYERLPIQVIREKNSDGDSEDGSKDLVDAQAYFAHSSYGEKMWERSGRIGLSEFCESASIDYVKKKDRPNGRSILDDIESFLSGSLG